MGTNYKDLNTNELLYVSEITVVQMYNAMGGFSAGQFKQICTLEPVELRLFMDILVFAAKGYYCVHRCDVDLIVLFLVLVLLLL